MNHTHVNTHAEVLERYTVATQMLTDAQSLTASSALGHFSEGRRNDTSREPVLKNGCPHLASSLTLLCMIVLECYCCECFGVKSDNIQCCSSAPTHKQIQASSGTGMPKRWDSNSSSATVLLSECSKRCKASRTEAGGPRSKSVRGGAPCLVGVSE